MNHIRIIGGLYRGKKIRVLEEEGLRPTSDRIRETLFNWLMNEIKDTRCLDLFAGTGALGLEAYSRGAASVVLVEQAPVVYNQLKKTIAEFKSTSLRIIKENALNYLQHCQEQFNIIFLDPPFAKQYHLQCLDLIIQRNILAPNGLVYIESPELLPLDETQWKTIKLKKAGQVYYGLWGRCGTDPTQTESDRGLFEHNDPFY